MELELNRDHVAAVVAVESHHTVQHGWIPLSELVPMAHAAGVPVIVDGAAQDLRFQELIGYGSDLVIASAHKFLCSTTAGVVAGRRELVEAVYLQNRGIGRGMKAGRKRFLEPWPPSNIACNRTWAPGPLNRTDVWH